MFEKYINPEPPTSPFPGIPTHHHISHNPCLCYSTTVETQSPARTPTNQPHTYTPTMVKPTTCCGRSDSCICAEKATCSCGKQSAMNCSCERKAQENTLSGARCSCRKPFAFFPYPSSPASNPVMGTRFANAKYRSKACRRMHMRPRGDGERGAQRRDVRVRQARPGQLHVREGE